jgi:hypothetical protein
MGELSVEAVLSRYRAAQSRRKPWESLWQDCYTYALPQRGSGFGSQFDPARRHAERLFDGTATDAVEQLAASLLSQLTPPWSQWFGLVAGHDISGLERAVVAEELDRTTETLQGHFDRSNFAVEIHQAFLDLVTVGSATLLFEEAPIGDLSAFRLTAVPMAEMWLEAGPDGQINGHFRETTLSLDALFARFPDAELPRSLLEECRGNKERALPVIEAVLPAGRGFHYLAMLHHGSAQPILLGTGQFESSPFISFRWLKGAGEVYGRSPVMTVLPDIKTVNKVVELVLKNASISVTGIWQADDDGVLNPANIQLVPGSIIPKAVGSAGLTPLQAPGRFDISSLLLDDLRGRIRHALLVDRLGAIGSRKMTATEVLERSAEMTRLLGATYGRLQAELLTPLLGRAMGILRRRGEIPDLTLDGRLVDLHYKSPLARLQAQQDVQSTLLWLETTARMGAEAMATVDLPATARWLGDRLGVPGQLIRDVEMPAGLLELADELIEAASPDATGADHDQ